MLVSARQNHKLHTVVAQLIEEKQYYDFQAHACWHRTDFFECICGGQSLLNPINFETQELLRL